MTDAERDVWNEAVARAGEDPTPENRALVESLKSMHLRRLHAKIGLADGLTEGTDY